MVRVSMHWACNGCNCMLQVQVLADAIKAQTAELRASVDSLKDMMKAFEQNQKDTATKETTGISLADLRQELRSFAGSTQYALHMVERCTAWF